MDIDQGDGQDLGATPKAAASAAAPPASLTGAQLDEAIKASMIAQDKIVSVDYAAHFQTLADQGAVSIQLLEAYLLTEAHQAKVPAPAGGVIQTPKRGGQQAIHPGGGGQLVQPPVQQIKIETNDTNKIDFSSYVVGGQKSLDPITQVNVKSRPTVKRTSVEEDVEEVVEEAVEARTKEAQVAGSTVTIRAALEASEAASVDHSTQVQHSLQAQGEN